MLLTCHNTHPHARAHLQCATITKPRSEIGTLRHCLLTHTSSRTTCCDACTASKSRCQTPVLRQCPSHRLPNQYHHPQYQWCTNHTSRHCGLPDYTAAVAGVVSYVPALHRTAPHRTSPHCTALHHPHCITHTQRPCHVPNAPPISAPLVPTFTFTMPQSDPRGLCTQVKR